MKNVLVGCCGWAVKGGKQAYFKVFPVVEIQETFYRLPRTETVKRWRENAPSNFVFCMKAWQAVSHPVTSPTWRRAGIKPLGGEASTYGWLRPSKENFDAWTKTAEVAEAMGAKVVVVQTPPTMPDTEESYQNVETFFEFAAKFGFFVGWEPRGKTASNVQAVKRVCEKTGVIHVTDLLKREPSVEQTILYTRLHGLDRREVNYSYKYSLEDLATLAAKLRSRRFEQAFVMFNNISMAEDARKFMQMLNRENQRS